MDAGSNFLAQRANVTYQRPVPVVVDDDDAFILFDDNVAPGSPWGFAMPEIRLPGFGPEPGPAAADLTARVSEATNPDLSFNADNSSVSEELTNNLQFLDVEQQPSVPSAAVFVDMVKRKSTRSAGGRKHAASEAAENKKGFVNPFLPLSPRIPDGSVATSLAHRYQNVTTIAVPAGSVSHILMFPGLNGGIFHFNNTASNTDIGNVGAPNVVNYSGSEEKLRLGLSSGSNTMNFTTTDIAGAGAAIKDYDNFEIGNYYLESDQAQWRVVSQGCRLALLNTDEQNDGWFESCRIPVGTKASDYMVHFPSNTLHAINRGADANSTEVAVGSISTTTSTPCFCPSVQALFDLVTKNLAESDGYAAAPLKMIGAALWTLLPYKESMEFRQLDAQYKVDAKEARAAPGYSSMTFPTNNGVGVQNGNPIGFEFSDGSKAGKRMTEQLMDLSRDMVYLRIHAGETHAKTLLLTHVANHEVVYRIDTSLHKHMRPTSLDDTFKALLGKFT
jgi:hypothetical protein